MSRMVSSSALGRATLLASVLLLGALISGVPAHAQTVGRRLMPPPSLSPNAPLSPSQQLQMQSYANALGNRERQLQSRGGAPNGDALLRAQQHLNSLQLQQLQHP